MVNREVRVMQGMAMSTIQVLPFLLSVFFLLSFCLHYQRPFSTMSQLLIVYLLCQLHVYFGISVKKKKFVYK